MALKHFLRVYPMPENPKIYTGLFRIPLSERKWSDKPNKIKTGVSYTQFEDAYDVKLSEALTLFDMVHGFCSYFADYFWYKNQDWQEVCMYRGNFYNSIIHSYCVKKLPDRTLFADARGITDDPSVFFADFTCGKDMYVEELTDNDRVSEGWFDKSYKTAYGYTYGNSAATY